MKAKIVRNLPLGGALLAYTVYGIDVTHEGSTWCVYRRYSEFEKLHSVICHDVGEEFAAQTYLLPEKSIQAKFLKEAIEKRGIELQKYMDDILSNEEICCKDYLLEFFDCNCKGISGAQKDLGSSLLYETLGYAKPCVSLIELWMSCFIVMSKQGTIFILRNMYDGISDAIVAFPLTGREVHISVPITAKYAICLTDVKTKRQLKIRLSSELQLGTWMRTIADFTTKHLLNVGPTSYYNKSTIQSGPELNNLNQASDPVFTGPTIVIKTKGTGNTQDELSSMYGI
jgi:hypothetical protein